MSNDPYIPSDRQPVIARAVEALRAGGLVGHPTEGVWGLACDPHNESAVDALLALKQRSVDQGLIVIGDSAAAFEPELAALTEQQRAAVVSTWPDAVTFILPNQQFPAWITGGRPGVAARVPDHDLSRALCAAFGGALVSTSLNPSGAPPALTEEQARAYFPSLAAFVAGDTSGREGPSQLRDAITGEILRP